MHPDEVVLAELSLNLAQLKFGEIGFCGGYDVDVFFPAFNIRIKFFFSGLSAEREVTSPIADMPWGAKFGALTDKYGKHWMFNL